MSQHLCFNPCYSGSNSKIHITLFYVCFFHFVSILVIVEVTLKFTIASSFSSGKSCFNPCYSGSNSKIKTHCEACTLCIHVSILVIVEVTLKSERRALNSRLALCFNPCYSGSNSKIERKRKRKVKVRKFQSLL